MALRVIGRRSPAGSMTLVGDVAQSTAPAGQERWVDVFASLAGDPAATGEVAELTIGYRVPEPILDHRQPPAAAHGRRRQRQPQRAGRGRRRRVDRTPSPAELAATVAASWPRVKHRHRLTGVVAPLAHHDDITAALDDAGLHAVDHLHQLHHGEVPLFGPEQVKGLEFDGVVVVEPDEILGDTPRGARLLYVAMTRAVQELAFVDDGGGSDAGDRRARPDVAGARADQLADRRPARRRGSSSRRCG